MIYNKLDGTSSNKFRIGKKGPELKNSDGKVTIEEQDGTTRLVGIDNIRLDDVDTNDIPTTGAVNHAINSKMRTLTAQEMVNYSIIENEIRENDYVFIEKEVN